MSKNYQKIQEALSLEAFESDKSNGIYLTEDYAEKIESALAEKENYQLTLDAKMAEIAALNAAINSLKTEHETGMANMKAEHEQAVSDLNDGYEQKLNASKEEDGRIIAELRNQLADKEAGMAELNAQIKEKDEQIQTLSENAPQAPLPTAPQAEAAKKSTEEDGTTQSIYSEGMSRAERRAARDARMKTLRQ